MTQRLLFFTAVAGLVAATHCAAANAEDLGQQPVNSFAGVACPAVNGGKPALCFSASGAKVVVETLLNRSACIAKGDALVACQHKSQALAAAVTAQDRTLEATSIKLGLLQKAVDSSQASGKKLESVISSLKWKVVLGVIGGAVGAGAVGYALGRYLPR